VHDPHLQDPPLPAGTEVLGDQVLHVAGVEGVEIERAVDRKGDGIRELVFGVVGIRSTHRDPPEEGDRSLRSTGRIVPNLVTSCTGKLRSLLVVLALVAVPATGLLGSCDSGDGTLAALDPGAVPLGPSYDRVVQILDRNCVPCHKGDGEGGFEGEGENPDYDSCQGIRAGIAGLIQTAIDAESMPPGAWPRLSEEDKLVITRWIENGACSPCSSCP